MKLSGSGKAAAMRPLIMLYSRSEAEGDLVWFFDPYASDREYSMISGLIAAAFPEPESFMDYCREKGLKYGWYYTYDLRFMPDTDFEGFDFENIWEIDENGRPQLRIFG